MKMHTPFAYLEGKFKETMTKLDKNNGLLFHRLEILPKFQSISFLKLKYWNQIAINLQNMHEFYYDMEALNTCVCKYIV